MRRRTADAGRALREARARKARAHAHLRRRRGEQRAPRPWRPARAAAVLGVSLLAGTALGSPWLAGAARWLPAGSALAAIHVRGAAQLSPREIAEATGVAPGAPLLGIDPDAVARRLVAHPWIVEARAVRLPAAGLLVDVVEREPLALAETPSGDYFVDAAGVPFAPARGDVPRALPRLLTAAPATPLHADPELAAGVALVLRLPALGVAPPAAVEIRPADDPAGFVLHLAEPAVAITLGRAGLDAALVRLSELFALPPPELAEAARIDLRFADQAVLRGEPAPRGEAKAAEGRGGARPSKARPVG